MNEWIWQPDPEAARNTNVHRMMRRLGFASLDRFLEWSREEPEQFWEEMLRETGVDWFHPYERVCDLSRGVEWARWFTGGQINIAANCLDRHVENRRPAILWEGENGATRSISFAELSAQACRVASALKRLGLEAGDRVALSMPLVPEVISAFYGCLKAGMIVTPIFAGFGPHAVSRRLQDSGARVLITSDGIRRRGRNLPLKEKLDAALPGSAVEKVVVLGYTGNTVPWNPGRDIHLDTWLESERPDFPTLPVDSEAPGLLLYTSGTTGKPKGCVHTHAGALAQITKEIHLAFDHQPGDRFFWLTDMGWMMGPWTVFGNHHFGGTIFLYDGAPDYPKPDRLWRMIDTHGITTFGISPTAIRILMRAGDNLPAAYPMSSLRLLGSTGEPWDDTSWLWFFEHIGRRRCPIINISGGTEIVGCFVFPLPAQPLKACTVGQAAPGMDVAVVDDDGNLVRNRMGYLACCKPAPSMTRGIWKDPERYLETYWSRFPGWWNHGDWASIDKDGYWFLHGRADESMNIAGRKVGPAEVEETLMQYSGVAEAAVIGIPDDLKGEAIAAFVVPGPGVAATPEWIGRVIQHLTEQLGPTFRPKSLLAVPELPKTQSGKIVRRLIRQRFLGELLGDLSTVQNPDSLDHFSNDRPGVARSGSG